MIKLFLISSILFFVALLTGKLYFYNHHNRFVKEKSVMLGTYLMIFYILSAIVTIFFIKTSSIFIILLCALSPFIIGHFASYKKLSFYTSLQLLVIILGILAVIL